MSKCRWFLLTLPPEDEDLLKKSDDGAEVLTLRSLAKKAYEWVIIKRILYGVVAVIISLGVILYTDWSAGNLSVIIALTGLLVVIAARVIFFDPLGNAKSIRSLTDDFDMIYERNKDEVIWPVLQKLR